MPRDEPGLRERKKRRTRLALTEAALRLFHEQGYERTTVAQIAAAADVSTRTFFGYFPTKEDVLFGDTDERLHQLREAIADAPTDAPIATVLRTGLTRVLTTSAGLTGPHGPTRIHLVLTHPQLRAKGLERVLAAHQELAQWLRSHPKAPRSPGPDALAGAILGTLIGTVVAALSGTSPADRLPADLDDAITFLAGMADGAERAL